MHWISHLHERLAAGTPLVVVTIIAISGSAPRSPGARMLVEAQHTTGTIGGGNLEHAALQIAQRLLEKPEHGAQHREHYSLGTFLNQSCGGTVELLFETFTRTPGEWLDQAAQSLTATPAAEAVWLCGAIDGAAQNKHCGTATSLPPQLAQAASHTTAPTVITLPDGSRFFIEAVNADTTPLYLFGAGHVGRAVVSVLSGLPFTTLWIDARDSIFPTPLPPNVKTENSDPLPIAATLAPGTFALVMTHSHSLDFDICTALLTHQHHAWAGMIGSRTKRHKCEAHLKKHGITTLERWHCPIGIDGITDKTPETIAVSVAAQLLREREAV